MLKKHLVVLLLMVMAVGVYAQSIPSGTGRYEALGSSPYILDAATDIYNNPVWSSYYRNYAFGDIGRDVVNDFQLSGQYAGVSRRAVHRIDVTVIYSLTANSAVKISAEAFNATPRITTSDEFAARRQRTQLPIFDGANSVRGNPDGRDGQLMARAVPQKSNRAGLRLPQI
jgi:hypothetical protein